MSKLAELTDAYVAGPAQLRAAVTGMTREQLLARPIPGKWNGVVIEGWYCRSLLETPVSRQSGFFND